MKIVSKAEFARLAGVDRSAVTQWIKAGILYGPALVGDGPRAKINVEIGLQQVHARRDPSQAASNGAKTRTRIVSNPKPATARSPEAADEDLDEVRSVAPTVSSDVQERIAEERLKEIERRNRQGDDEEAARRGIFTLTGDMNRSMNVVAVQMMRAFEGMLPDMATAVAAELKVEYRDVLHTMMQSSLKARQRMHERAAASGAHIPATHEVDTAALLRSHGEERP